MNIFEIESGADSTFAFYSPVSVEDLHLLVNNCLLELAKHESHSLSFSYDSTNGALIQKIILMRGKRGAGEALVNFTSDYVDPILGYFLILSGHSFDGTMPTDNGKVVRIKFLIRLRKKSYTVYGHMVLNPMRERFFTLSRIENYPERVGR